MITTRFASSSDLPHWAVVVAISLAVLDVGLLFLELRRRERGGVLIVVTGVLALATLVLAVLRPVRVAAKETVVGPRVVVLLDQSRSMALQDGAGRTREGKRDEALDAFVRRAKDARPVLLGFGDGPPVPFDKGKTGAGPASRASRSDLATALRALGAGEDEHPSAVVVISDGRLDDPQEDASAASLETLARSVGVPIHAIATTKNEPKDASIRRVASSGSAVAHVPFPLHIEVGCGGGLVCNDLTVSAREVREGAMPALLATGVVKMKDGKGAVDLTVTLDRAGTRILEVAVEAPEGDTIPENNRRLLTLHVAREHVRILHVAGRPTSDVRALRERLKSDASVDVVAFFILRTPTDNPEAEPQDLSLIPFPVDELFSEHLPSFDAVILQDFDAQPYGLEKHLPALARYVRDGGGLIMVGGPNSFVGGGYADTPLANDTGVLPVRLKGGPTATAADTSMFDPAWTEQGRTAPLLGPLRAIVGDELPAMPGANILGDARPGAVVLWTHPTLKTPSGAPMPVLAVAEQGAGRTIALGVDGGWRLEFSPLGARTAGRGYGALWDGLLGWLMRDPRFEPAQVEVVGGCTAGLPATVRVHVLSGSEARKGSLVLDLTRLDAKVDPKKGPEGAHRSVPEDPSGTTEIALPPLSPGAYVTHLEVPGGGSTDSELACEAGGDEWADSRPDGARLEAIAKASGGTFSWAEDDLTRIPLPPPTVISAERHTAPIAPPWVWTVLASLLLGAHWIVRRRGGLA
jgi:uncharacterized membrane protein